MVKRLIPVILLLFLLVISIGCSSKVTDTPTVPTQPQPTENPEAVVSEVEGGTSAEDGENVVTSTEDDEAVKSAENDEVVFNEVLEKYYDYFRENNQIVVLLDYPYNENGFTDDAMAAFAIMSLENYDYEKGNTMEEYHAITEKYFGRRIENFNNSMSEIIPRTNMVRATGWSFNSSVFMILKSLVDEPDGSKTAEFYTLNISDSVFTNLPQKTAEEMKRDLLSGNFSVYGEPFITRLKFEEKTDENGNMYLKYLELKILDEKVDKMVPYGSE